MANQIPEFRGLPLVVGPAYWRRLDEDHKAMPRVYNGRPPGFGFPCRHDDCSMPGHLVCVTSVLRVRGDDGRRLAGYSNEISRAWDLDAGGALHLGPIDVWVPVHGTGWRDDVVKLPQATVSLDGRTKRHLPLDPLSRVPWCWERLGYGDQQAARMTRSSLANAWQQDVCTWCWEHAAGGRGSFDEWRNLAGALT